ncbi:MAG: AAA family ATPase [Candidatus Midichloria sp.]|nr:AAA family ATPase [Candidatus Midichloria sp.]
MFTGVFDIFKKGLGSGLNHVKIYDLTNPEFQDDFGFSQEEVDNLIDKIGFGEHTQLIKNNIREWYGNYNLIDDDFHIAAVYKPWSIVNYLSSAIKNPHAKPQDYWANSGSSTELAELIRQAIALDVDKTLNLLEGKEQPLQLN